ncbi:DUF4785 domain-containing protein [Litorilituus lipolyticus]|uniref:DUF4785 family protein n=1 Tax=Litorilituus lipolyticus TaxID=2491017 RepID=A0A502KYS9_9GAMM|nr:DUF4785 domain-containing protein [Litorilituus lipolyticus]TPH15649.1 DUF4785 family protein [Litorilituus lipolyticus]
MKNNKNVVMGASLSVLLLSSSLHANSLAIGLKDNGFKQAKLSEIAVEDYDLVNVDLMSSSIERQSVHFSQAISSANKVAFKNQGYTDISDEYWFEVTGRELMAGVAVAISQPGALIRLSGKSVKNDMRNMQQHAIEPEFVSLLKAGVTLKSAFSQKVTAEQFATANIFPNSSALQLNKTLGAGKFTLKVEQLLEEDQRYMVNVKEKNAEHKLHLTIDKQSYRAGQDILFNSKLLSRQGHALLGTQKVSVKLPNGEVNALEVVKLDNQFKITLPQHVNDQNTGQLYELLIVTEAQSQGVTVKRNGKVAFAVNRPTARLEGKVDHKADSVAFNVNVASEGRYEISGIVYGTNQQGDAVPFMLSRSAYYLPVGIHQRKLAFDQTIIDNSGLQAPYTVKSVQLMDQSRLALLQQL